MSCTINFTQFKRKKKNDGTIPVYIRLTENKESVYISTGISVFQTDWNDRKQEVRKSNDKHKVYNDELRSQFLKVEKNKFELKRRGKLTINTLKKSVVKNDLIDLMGRVKSFHESLRTKRYWEWKRFGVLVNNLETFIDGRKIYINKVDTEFIEDFQDFLLTEASVDKRGNTYGNNPNTVLRKLTSLKGFFNHLIKRKEIDRDPFLQIDKVQEQPSKKTKLTLEQIQAIKNLNLEKKSRLWHVRNYFMYSYYNAGIRFGDLCTLKWGDIVDGRLVYKMRKTKQQKSIKELEPMKKILSFYRSETGEKSDEYIFPILDKKYSETKEKNELRAAISSNNAQVNIALKKIAEKAGIQANVSFHVSRHSFSQLALEKKMNIYAISKALGHSNIKTTERYVKSFDEELLDKEMSELF